MKPVRPGNPHPFVRNRQARAVASPQNMGNGAVLHSTQQPVNYQAMRPANLAAQPAVNATTRPSTLYRKAHGAPAHTGMTVAANQLHPVQANTIGVDIRNLGGHVKTTGGVNVSRAASAKTTKHGTQKRNPPHTHPRKDQKKHPNRQPWKHDNNGGNQGHKNGHQGNKGTKHKNHNPSTTKHKKGGGSGSGGNIGKLLQELLANSDGGLGSTGTSIPGPTVVSPTNTDSWVGVAVIGLIVTIAGGAIWYIIEHKHKKKPGTPGGGK